MNPNVRISGVMQVHQLYACLGGRGIWEISVPTQFFCEPQTVVENKVYS